MPRTWTKESEAAWRQSRNEQRRSNGLCDFEDLSADDKAAALDDERKTILSLTEKRLKQEAWPLEKRPLQAYIAPCNGTIQLPSQFRDDKYDKVKFYKGDNLNQLSYRHYNQPGSSELGRNYVNEDSVRPSRHEYLGPRPLIAGYRFVRAGRSTQADVLFWDSHLQMAWVGRQKWNVELEFDETVEAWFVPDGS